MPPYDEQSAVVQAALERGKILKKVQGALETAIHADLIDRGYDKPEKLRNVHLRLKKMGTKILGEIEFPVDAVKVDKRVPELEGLIDGLKSDAPMPVGLDVNPEDYKSNSTFKLRDRQSKSELDDSCASRPANYNVYPFSANSLADILTQFNKALCPENRLDVTALLGKSK